MALDFFTKEHEYHKIYVDFVSRISNGEYRAGERLPGCMAVAREYGVSKTTAYSAYKQLESGGFVTLNRSGTFVADTGGFSPQASLAELLADTIERAKNCGISERDLTGAIEILVEKYC